MSDNERFDSSSGDNPDSQWNNLQALEQLQTSRLPAICLLQRCHYRTATETKLIEDHLTYGGDGVEVKSPIAQADSSIAVIDTILRMNGIIIK